MTFEEVCQTMATKSGARTAEDWAEFFSMPPELQEAEAKLVQDAVVSQPDGSSFWTDSLNFLGIAATVVTDVAGIGTGYQVLKALL
jgi:hypothetical protein